MVVAEGEVWTGREALAVHCWRVCCEGRQRWQHCVSMHARVVVKSNNWEAVAAQLLLGLPVGQAPPQPHPLNPHHYHKYSYEYTPLIAYARRLEALITAVRQLRGGGASCGGEDTALDLSFIEEEVPELEKVGGQR